MATRKNGQGRREAERDSAEGTGGGITLVNPGTTSVVYDDEGRSVDAGGRVTVPALDATGRHCVAKGYLVVESDTTAEDEEDGKREDGDRPEPPTTVDEPEASRDDVGAPTRE